MPQVSQLLRPCSSGVVVLQHCDCHALIRHIHEHNTIQQEKESELVTRQHELQLLEQEAHNRALAEAAATAAAVERAAATARAVTAESETAVQYETNLGRLLSGGRQWQQLHLLAEQQAAVDDAAEQTVETVGATALGSVLLHGDGWKTVSQKPLQTGNTATAFQNVEMMYENVRCCEHALVYSCSVRFACSTDTDRQRPAHMQPLSRLHTDTTIRNVTYVLSNALMLLHTCMPTHIVTEPAQRSAAEVLYSLNNNNNNTSSSTSDDVSTDDVAQLTRTNLQVQQFEQELYAAAAAEQRQTYAKQQRRLQQQQLEAAAAARAAAAVLRDTSVQTDTVVQVVPQPEAPGALASIDS
jgi:hypothetical protein